MKKFKESKLWFNYMKLKHEPRVFLYQYPTTFKLLANLNRKKKHILVNKDSEIVIEGFPRSGNTFAHVAFEYAQGRDVNIASHFHAPGQIIWGVKSNVPTLLLIREPVDAVSSLLIRENYLSEMQVLRWYIEFYQSVYPYMNRLVLADFNEVISDFGQVMIKINKHYSTSFIPFEHSEENVQTCFRIIEDLDRQDTKQENVTEKTVSRPSKIRNRLKIDVKKRLQTNYSQILHEAQKIYQLYLDDLQPIYGQPNLGSLES